jgi:hypothetical protein
MDLLIVAKNVPVKFLPLFVKVKSRNPNPSYWAAT